MATTMHRRGLALVVPDPYAYGQFGVVLLVEQRLQRQLTEAAGQQEHAVQRQDFSHYWLHCIIPFMPRSAW